MKKPTLTFNKRYKQGIYPLKNPHKYVGDASKVIYRSGLEYRYFKFFDEQPAILFWGSEEITVNYFSSMDGKIRRYFPDFVIKVQTKEGPTKVFMIEIKPESQCQQPKQPKRQSKRYTEELITWNRNKDKWRAASTFCENRGMQFLILTEQHLKHNW